MHVLIAIPASIRTTATPKARALWKTASDADIFGLGQRYKHTDTLANWYVACGPTPDIGIEAMLKFRDNNIPEALIEEFSMEFNPDFIQDKLSEWKLILNTPTPS